MINIIVFFEISLGIWILDDSYLIKNRRKLKISRHLFFDLKKVFQFFESFQKLKKSYLLWRKYWIITVSLRWDFFMENVNWAKLILNKSILWQILLQLFSRSKRCHSHYSPIYTRNLISKLSDKRIGHV